MRTYKIYYMHGQSRPSKPFSAVDDADFYRQLAEWERTSGFKHEPNTMECTVRKTSKVAEPPITEAAQAA